MAMADAHHNDEHWVNPSFQRDCGADNHSRYDCLGRLGGAHEYPRPQCSITANTQGAQAIRDAEGPSWCVHAPQLQPTKPDPSKLRSAPVQALKEWLYLRHTNDRPAGI